MPEDVSDTSLRNSGGLTELHGDPTQMSILIVTITLRKSNPTASVVTKSLIN
jgi:hypothetical protein